MSWSFSAIGTPEKIAAALDEESGKLSGQSKVEFDDAMPHLQALLRQNFVAEGSGYTPPLVEFSASGSGSALTPRDPDGGLTGEVKQLQRQCSVAIKPMYARPLI